MIIVSCPDCGKHLLWHLAHEHRCDKQPQKSSPVKKPTTSPVAKTEASSVSSPSSRRTVKPPPEPVTTPAARNYGIITSSEKAAEVARVTEWRAENRERYNAYMREWRLRQKQVRD